MSEKSTGKGDDLAIVGLLTFDGLLLGAFGLAFTPLFIGPVSTFGTSTFGQITQVGGFARSLQFQVRVGW